MRRVQFLLVVLVSVLSACGTRVDHAEVAAVARGASSGSAANGTPVYAAASPSVAATAGPSEQALAGGSATAAASSPTVATSRAGTAPAGPASSGVAGPTRPLSPVRIASIGTFSGPGGKLLKDPADAIGVWVRWINARGGVNGHTVKHLFADDGGDPARHRALVRQLVERDHIQAFVYKSEVFAGLATPDPYIVENRIPVVGTFLGYEYDYDSPYYFPEGSSGEELSAAYLGGWSEVAIPKGKHKLGIVVCAESSVCDFQGRAWAKRAGEFGFQTVYRAKASITQPDYTAECLAARQNGVDMFAIGLDDNSIARVAQSCQRQGYQPLYGIPHLNAVAHLAANPLLEGTLVGVPTFAFPAADNPARREFHDAFAEFAPGKPVTSGHAVGWVVGKLFEAATKSLPEPPTSSAILRTLWSMRDDDLGGLTSPLSFFPDRGAQRHTCWSLVVISGGRYVAPRGGGMKCLR